MSSLGPTVEFTEISSLLITRQVNRLGAPKLLLTESRALGLNQLEEEVHDNQHLWLMTHPRDRAKDLLSSPEGKTQTTSV